MVQLKMHSSKRTLIHSWQNTGVIVLKRLPLDVMGILNMGPAVAVATIGFFRALNAVIYKNKQFKLDNVGISEDVHPADILRGYLAASVVRLLEFNGADKWADYIEAETNKDLTTIRLDANPRDPNSGKVIASDEAKKSAKIVTKTIVEGKMKSLEDHSLGEIQLERRR